jgi:hypothetical protein
MHGVQYSKITPIYLYHTYRRQEHATLEPHGVGYITVTKRLLCTLILLTKNQIFYFMFFTLNTAGT